METRSIQKTGGSSYIVTLPKLWVLDHDLDKKGNVDIHALPGGQLLIRSQKKKSVSRASIVIDYYSEPHIVRELIGLYVSGVEEIEVRARAITYEQRALVRSVSYKLFGFELFEQTSERILLKNVASSTITAPEYCQKMIDIVHSMFLDIVRVVETQDKRLASDIVERDIEVDRIHLVILRQFHKMLHAIVQESPSDLPASSLHYYEHVAIRLERIADHLVHIASTILLLRNGESVSLNKFEHANLAKLNLYFLTLKELIQSVDQRKAHTLLDLYDSQPKNEYMTPKNITKPSINIMIEDSIERIRSYIANIAEETINYNSLKDSIL